MKKQKPLLAIFSFIIIAFSITALASCISDNTNSQKKDIEKQDIVKDIFYYVEFIDMDNTNTSQKVIMQVKLEIFANRYIAGIEENDWQGIRKTEPNEKINIADLNKYHPNIHQFRNFSEYNSNQIEDFEKIVITYNKAIENTIPNFNFRSYRKLGHEEWQSVFNPGNFRYKEKQDFSENDLAEWIIDHIVLLTFK